MDIAQSLWILWLIYWVSGAFVGSFFGVLAALGARALYRKVVKWYNKED